MCLCERDFLPKRKGRRCSALKHVWESVSLVLHSFTDFLSIKAPIHEATLLSATVACNNVATCMMQCCVVAHCRQLLVAFRLQFYFQATVAGNCFQQQCCLMYGGLKLNSCCSTLFTVQSFVVLVQYLFKKGRSRRQPECFRFLQHELSIPHVQMYVVVTAGRALTCQMEKENTPLPNPP